MYNDNSVITSTQPMVNEFNFSWKPLEPELVLQALNGVNRLESIRTIKNQIIGSLSKKALFVSLGIIPLLVSIVANETDEEICAQTITVLGSFARGSQNESQAIVNEGCISILIEKLSHSNPKIVSVCVATLKTICQAIETVPKEITKNHTTINILISLLNRSNLDSESAAFLLGKCGEELALLDSSIVKSSTIGLFALLNQNQKAQEAALEAISSLTYENPTICSEFSTLYVKPNITLIKFLVGLLKDKKPKIRLLACSILCNFKKDTTNKSTEFAAALKLLLPTLVKLLADSSVEIRIAAPLVLARVIENNEALQKSISTETDAISKLADFFKEDPNAGSMSNGGSSSSSSVTSMGSNGTGTDAVSFFYKISLQDKINQAKLKESALLALAAICSKREENRKQVVDAQLVPKLVLSLEHSEVNVRAAACQLARSLSRSVKNLRSSLVDAGAAKPLFKLLSDSSVSVQIAASATICNIVLDFSPMKKIVLEQGAVPQLVSLTLSQDHELKLNSIWALKNLLYQADSSDKDKVIDALGWDVLGMLLNDPHPDIQEQSLTLVRNLVYGYQEDIEKVMQGFGNNLLSILEAKLNFSNPTKVIIQALYIICNIGTGNEKHKTVLMQNSAIIQSLLASLNHSDANVRVGAVWCVINLAWSEEPGAADRIQTLRTLGFESRLKSIMEDPELDVRDRVKTALEQFAKHP